MKGWFEHLRAHPPRCLDALATRRPHVRRADDGGYESTRAIGCACGGPSARILGTALEGQALLGSPLALSCPSCGRTAPLLDVEAGGRARSPRPRVEARFVCPTCAGATLIALTATFRYAASAPDLARGEGGAFEDRFASLLLRGTCAACSAEVDVAALDV